MKSYRIKQVAKLTGLSSEVLRIWEKRYGLLSPRRGPNRYRIYTEEDVEFLKFLVAEMNQGQSIGELATFGKDELLVRMTANREDTERTIESVGGKYDPLIMELESNLINFDSQNFENKLNEIIALFPFEEVFHKILVPLQIRVGELWFEGKLGVAVEHYVTSMVRQKLSAVMNHLSSNREGPMLVVCCPPWELHEIGAQTVAYHCLKKGCRVSFLGANLPLEDLIDFCNNTNPDAVIISFSQPFGDSKGKRYLIDISTKVSNACPIFIGGQALKIKKIELEKTQIRLINDLDHLDKLLENLN